MMKQPLRFALVWLAALLLGLSSASSLLAAAPAQDDGSDLEGVYRTAPMENEITCETIERQITLLAGGVVESITHFQKRGSLLYEAGEWLVDDEGLLVVTLFDSWNYRNGRKSGVEPPTEIPFEIEDGDLIARDYLAYGPRDLLLARTKDKPDSFLDEDGALRADLIVESEEWPSSLFVGAYRTQEFELQGQMAWVRLELAEEGSATLTYSPIEDELLTTSEAIWYNEGNGSITVAILADLDPEGGVIDSFDPPQERFELDRMESGALSARVPALPDGGQLIFSYAKYYDEPDPDAVAGLYAGSETDAEGILTGRLLQLQEDGNARLVVSLFAGEQVPQTLLGIWGVEPGGVWVEIVAELLHDGEEATVTDLEDVTTWSLQFDAETLVGDGLRFGRVAVAETTTEREQGSSTGGSEEADDEPSSGGPTTDSTWMVSREQLVAGNTIVLALNADMSASMSTQLGPDADSLLELGSWEIHEGIIIVTLSEGLDGMNFEEYDEPQELMFEITAPNTLTALDYDAERYGEDLVLYNTADY